MSGDACRVFFGGVLAALLYLWPICWARHGVDSILFLSTRRVDYRVRVCCLRLLCLSGLCSRFRGTAESTLDRQLLALCPILHQSTSKNLTEIAVRTAVLLLLSFSRS